MKRTKPKPQASYRLVAWREEGKPTTEIVLRWPTRSFVVPVYDGRWFGQRVFEWDGLEHTVNGLPVYR